MLTVHISHGSSYFHFDPAELHILWFASRVFLQSCDKFSKRIVFKNQQEKEQQLELLSLSFEKEGSKANSMNQPDGLQQWNNTNSTTESTWYIQKIKSAIKSRTASSDHCTITHFLWHFLFYHTRMTKIVRYRVLLLVRCLGLLLLTIFQLLDNFWKNVKMPGLSAFCRIVQQLRRSSKQKHFLHFWLVLFEFLTSCFVY